jgi:hypothetical protein
VAYPKPEESVPIGSPSQSTANRFPRDQFLRARGWSIHERRRGKPAKWRYHQTIATEAEALEIEQYERDQERRKVEHGA